MANVQGLVKMFVNIVYSLPVNNNKASPTIHLKGDTLHNYNRTPVLGITIKLAPSTNPITTMFTTPLHICKQQQTPTAKFAYFSLYLQHPSRYESEISQKPRL